MNVRRTTRRGFTLLEMLAAITIIGILAVIILPRISVQGFTAKAKVCDQYVSDINSAIERYYFETGAFPTQLSDLSPDYYPDVIPVCPATGAPYAIDGTSHTVIRHNH
jgi:general secretion pathway protein G